MNGKKMVGVALAVALLAGAMPAVSRGEQPYTVAWIRQLGTPTYDFGRSVAVDSAGNAFISGGTYGSLGGTNAGGKDAFLFKYDGSGNLLWSRQIGTASDDSSWSVAVDASGNAYISGSTKGSLGGTSAGNYDAFLTKYDGSGNLLWSRQVGTSSDDYSDSVAVDASGNAYISGYTYGSLNGPNAGGYDAFLSKYDTGGNLLWTEQLGTSSDDYSHSVAVDGAGNVFISGHTSGSLGGPNGGFDDAFLVKFVPEPGSAALLLAGLPFLIRRSRRKHRAL